MRLAAALFAPIRPTGTRTLRPFVPFFFKLRAQASLREADIALAAVIRWHTPTSHQERPFMINPAISPAAAVSNASPATLEAPKNSTQARAGAALTAAATLANVQATTAAEITAAAAKQAQANATTATNSAHAAARVGANIDVTA
jgi:hypothetical protein